MTEEFLDIRVRLIDAQQAAAAGKGVATSVKATAAAVKEADAAGMASRRGFGMFTRGAGAAGRAAKGLIGKAKGLAGSWFGAAKGMLAFGAAFASFEGVKRSVETTVQLGTAALRLHTNMGLDIKTGAEWAAIAKARGVEAKALTISFTFLSKAISGAVGGGKAQVKTFHDLGISQKELRKHGSDLNWVLNRVSDRFHDLRGSPMRAALAAKIFGRGYQTILPIINAGSKGIAASRKEVEKYGAVLGLKSVKDVKMFLKHQREAKYAMIGFQVAIGTTVLPILTKLITMFSHVALWLHGNSEGTKGLSKDFGAIGKAVGAILGPMIEFAGTVVHFVGQHPALLHMVATIIALGLALKIISFASSITGVTKLIGLSRALIGMRIGSAVGNEFAGGIGSGVSRGERRLSGARGRFRSLGGMLGRAVGIAAAVAIGVEIGRELENWLEDPIINAARKNGPGGDAARALLGYDPRKDVGVKGGKVVSTPRPGAPGIQKGWRYYPHGVNGLPPGYYPSQPRKPHPIGGAIGANIIRGGRMLVGEAGPEVVDLPSGARLQSNEHSAMVDRGNVLSAIRSALNVHAHVYLRDKEIARGVARVTEEDLART